MVSQNNKIYSVQELSSDLTQFVNLHKACSKDPAFKIKGFYFPWDEGRVERMVLVIILIFQMEELRHWAVCVFKSHSMAGIKIWQLDG